MTAREVVAFIALAILWTSMWATAGYLHGKNVADRWYHSQPCEVSTKVMHRDWNVIAIKPGDCVRTVFDGEWHVTPVPIKDCGPGDWKP